MNARLIAALFLLFGIAWILWSDRLLSSVTSDVDQLTFLQSVKGLVYVLSSTLLVYGLVRLAEIRRQRLERVAQVQRDQLEQIVEATPAALYSLRSRGDRGPGWEVTYVGPGIEAMTGFSPSAWMADQSLWRRRIHPEDLEQVLDVERRLPLEERVRQEYRIRRADERYIWVHDSAVVQRDDEGQVIGVVGVWLDITARREADEHARLIGEVFDLSQEGIMITDARTRLLSVNRAFCTVTGYSADEAVGRTPAMLKSGRQDAAFYRALWHRLRETGRWEGEVWNRRKSGDIYPAWLTISAIRNPDGSVLRYLGVFTETTVRKAAEDRIQRLANFDPLTGLPNRSQLVTRGAALLEATLAAGRPLLLLHVNLDRFGAINETLGHGAGDEVLRQVSARVAQAAGPEAGVFRLGGDEFVVLQPGSGIGEVPALAVRLLDAAAAPLQVDGHSYRLSACIGVAASPANGTELGALLQAADVAVRQAKREGHGLVRVASRELQERVQESLELAHELRWALERDQLSLHFQPQFDAASGTLVGCEALLRWTHPRLGSVSPGRFIPIAEEAGLIKDIGHWVLRAAVARNAAWQAAGLAVVPVAINLSAQQFRDPTLCADVLQALRDHQLDPALLELELTESIAIEDSEFTVGTINALKDLGVQLSIDDFGTGYSSLNYLRRFAVDKLKIDQSFVRGLSRLGQDKAIVATVIGLAGNLGLRTIAEGVETEEQLALLRELGCDEIQGYLTGRPMPAEDFEAVLRLRVSPLIAAGAILA